MADVAKPVSEPDGTDKTNRKPVANRMASLLSPFSKKQPKEPKVKDTKVKETKVKPPKAQPKEAKPKKQRVAGPKRSDKQALASALTLRNLTFGITGDGAPSSSYPRPALKQIKADLLNPHIANRVITQLHALPAPSGPTATGKDLTQPVLAPKEGESATSIVYPIHAACLNCTDDVAHDTIFHKLPSGPKAGNKPSETSAPSIPSVAYADIGNLLSTFKDVQAMSLLEAPDFGLGQPISGNGVLSGSVPTAATVSDGVTQITEQLMALGFATSNAVFPNHSGVYPPLDRMSVITYWWGMELVLPEPSMKHLDKMTSISHGILNFLSAVALVNNGVREILPFVRYISQFVEFEWTAIKAQDQGNGVVCASTWVMPAAMVPRPWDFPPSPPANKK